MNPERERQIERIYSFARESDPAARSSLLDEACGGDESLRKEVESLLASQAGIDRFMESPAIEVAAKALAQDQAQAQKPDLTGHTVAHFCIIEKIGAGGMGVVYRARDERLKRDVAVKVLPEIFAADSERTTRLEREARLLASVSHPNIAGIHGLEVAEGKRFLVLELVEGETLAQRLSRGPLPLEEALEICRQIAEGVEAAHEKGIIHRDLKPANIKIAPDGKVKVLDFGLAKAMSDESNTVDLTHSPTITEAHTHPGIILGTAGYMSPEQAKGKSVDKRTDIWAFGCILYECLAGKKAFYGETVTEIVAAILKGDPDWSLLSPTMNPKLVELLQRCLRKETKNRLQDIGDARIELQEMDLQPIRPAPPERWKFAAVTSWILFSVALVAAAVAAWLWLSAPTPGLSKRLTITLPAQAPLASCAATSPLGDKSALALSPDGARLAYVAEMGDHTQIWICDLTTGSFRALPDTFGGHTPFFSPDGASIAFFDKTSLKKLTLASGQLDALAEVSNPCGGSWGSDGFIYFNRNDQEGLFKVPSRRGAVEPVFKDIALTPEFLGTGDGLLASLSMATPATLAWINNGQVIKKLFFGFAARYVPTGHLVYAVRDSRLMAVPFDRSRHLPTGQPVMLADDLRITGYGTAQFAVSQDGTIVYASGRDQLFGSFVWVDHEGNTRQIGLPEAQYGTFSLSPDGTRIAVELRSETVEGGWDIWIYDITSGNRSRLTPPPEPGPPVLHNFPLWTPDGRNVVYWRESENQRELVSAAADHSAITVLCSSGPSGPQWLYPISFSWDGSVLAAFGPSLTLKRGDDLYLIRMRAPDGSSVKTLEPQLFLGTSSMEAFPQFSPDGNAIAYLSDESNKWNIWVTTYPKPGPHCQVSKTGGMDPTWSPDGRKIMYQWGPAMFVVDVLSVPDCQVGEPTRLFKGAFTDRPGFGHDTTSDGKKFLMLEDQVSFTPSTSLNVITNLASEVQRHQKK